MRLATLTTATLLFTAAAFAVDVIDPTSARLAAPHPATTSAPFSEKSAWVPISNTLLASLQSDNKKIGYPGKAAGITCDPTTGTVYMIIPDQGLYASTDHAATFSRIDNKTIGGRCETGATLQLDPAGGRLACFMLDGSAALTLDNGKTFTPITGVGRGWDFASVGWSAEKPAVILALHHEDGGQLYLSTDTGKTWNKNSKDPKYVAVGVLDAKTLLTAKSSGGISLSTDAGQTWKQTSDLTVTSHVPTIYKKIAYLISKDGLIASTDNGTTWAKRGDPVEATFGPIFKDEKQLIVWGKKGIYESTDSGATWKLILTMPKEYNSYNPEWFNNVGWDPKADIFYISHMGLPAYRWQR